MLLAHRYDIHSPRKGHLRDMLLRDMHPDNVYYWWNPALRIYCQRKLTFIDDRLPAISGIAALI